MYRENDDMNTTSNKKLNDQKHDDSLISESCTDNHLEDKHEEVLEEWYDKNKYPTLNNTKFTIHSNVVHQSNKVLCQEVKR